MGIELGLNWDEMGLADGPGKGVDGVDGEGGAGGAGGAVVVGLRSERDTRLSYIDMTRNRAYIDMTRSWAI